jgi:hypothetical protein
MMRHVVELWDAARNSDQPFLSKFIQWSGPDSGWQSGGVSYLEPAKPDGSRKFVPLIPSGSGHQELSPKLTALFTKPDLVLPARHALHIIVNNRIKELGATPRLLWDPQYGSLGATLRIVPASLIAALWLQLATAIDGDKRYRQCDVCREWFELSGDRRADARLCSNHCRSKAYRERQNKARRLAAAGSPVKEIAEKLGSHVRTVRGWIVAKGKRDAGKPKA